MKEKKSSVRLRKTHRRRLILAGVICILVAVPLLTFSALWRPDVPQVDVLMNESGISASGGVLHDEIVIQNRAAESVTVVVIIKTALDASPRMSAPVTVCGRCRVTVKIEEVQPQPGQNTDYYTKAIENPEYVRVEYPPNLLSNFASSAMPLGLGAVAVGIVLLCYSRTAEPNHRAMDERRE